MSETRKARAYNHIRKDLIAGRWAEGEFLQPAQLAKEVGVSYTPVREAMLQLVAEGLLEQLQQAGVCVKTLGAEELGELFELREMLEAGAARLAAERITPDELDRLEGLCGEHRELLAALRENDWRAPDSQWIDQMRRVETLFHMGVIGASRNQKTIRIVNDLHILTRILQRRVHMYIGDPRRDVRVYALHRRILRALRRGDAKDAYRQMSKHLAWAREYHLATYRRRQATVEAETQWT